MAFVVASSAQAQTAARPSPIKYVVARTLVTKWFTQAEEISAAISGDGRTLALGSIRSGSAVLWNPGASQLTPLGRSGSGPGEFRSASIVGFLHDSIGIFDAVQRRLSWFRADGRFSSAVSSPFLAILAAESDSNAVIGLPMSFFASAGSLKGRFAIERLNARGRTAVAEAPLPSDETLSVREAGGGAIRLRNPAGAARAWSISSDGSWVCEYGPENTSATPDAPIAVGCRSVRDARLRWRSPQRWTPTSIDRRWADSAATAFVDGTALPADVGRSVSAALIRYGRRSPIQVIRASPDGSAWLQSIGDAPQQRLSRLQHEKTSEWTLPPGSRLLAVNASHLLFGVDMDNGDTVVELWRLPK